MTESQLPLLYHCVALVVSEETDRARYVAPPIARDAHADTCGCASCVLARVSNAPRRVTV